MLVIIYASLRTQREEFKETLTEIRKSSAAQELHSQVLAINGRLSVHQSVLDLYIVTTSTGHKLQRLKKDSKRSFQGDALKDIPSILSSVKNLDDELKEILERISESD